jgi:hypothetical protein
MTITFSSAAADINSYVAEVVNPAGKVIGSGDGTTVQEAKREALRAAKVTSQGLLAKLTFNVRLEG